MTEKQIKRYFDLAKRAKDFSVFPKYNLGCVIVYKNKVISVGWNIEKENPVQKKYNRYRGYNTDKYNNYIHAEMKAIISVKDMVIDWDKASIFVYREYKDGNPAPAKPCPACTKVITDLGIKNIYYTSNGKYVHEILE